MRELYEIISVAMCKIESSDPSSSLASPFLILLLEITCISIEPYAAVVACEYFCYAIT